jgi:tRNA (mo5U34)-methyltransferase
MDADLAARVKALTWYHTIDLPGGVTTPGLFDVRGAVGRLPLPESLEGKRCLDIGTCDGFYAFELERRGAAEVVAIDLSDPGRRDLTPGVQSAEGATTRALQTFALAHEAFGSKVEWHDLSVYDLSPERVGTFDLVFMGSLLLHLRDPVGALQAVRSVTRGEFLSYDVVSPLLSVLLPRSPAARLHGHVRMEWWIPNKAGRRREIEAAGFEVVDSGGVSWVKNPLANWNWRGVRRRPIGAPLLALKGVPHTWVLARPRGQGAGQPASTATSSAGS